MSLRETLQRIITESGPKHVLLIAADDLPIPELPAGSTLSTAGGLNDLALDCRYDLALVDSDAPLDPADAEHVLARLRDFSARRVLVCLREPESGFWRRRTLMQQGFTVLADTIDGTRPVTLYRFDIADYKHTPDWLNPDNWANPELWDRYRW